MQNERTSQRTDAEELMGVLADERCRGVVSFFRSYPNDSASVETLASVLCGRDEANQRRFTVSLHHVTLPGLAEAGVVTYDPDERVVRYRGHPEMERLEGLVSAL